MTNMPMQNAPMPQKDWRVSYAKHSFNTIGWAAFTLIMVWFTLMTLVTMACSFLDVFGYQALDFYEEYMLIFNELTLGLAIAVSMAVLKPLPVHPAEGEKITVWRFIQYISIGFFIGFVGNLIGTGLLAFWNAVTGNEAGGEVEEMLTGSGYGIITLSVGLVAPFLEEFFFRKLLIDRLRPLGEMTCIVTSAVLFGLFHGNFTQFFYAAGLGAVLAYIYFRSDSLLTVFLFHAVFNLIGGVLPTILMSFGEDSILYLVYTVVYIVLVVMGLVFFIVRLTSFSAKKPLVFVPKGMMLSCVFVPGIIVAGTLMLLMMLLSLFQM